MITRVQNSKIAIALGSGAARGWAHIGVLQELLSMDIVPDIVCGSSIGAFVGAAYAHDQLDQLSSWVCKLNRREILRYIDFSLFGGGFISGSTQKQMLRQHFGDIQIENLAKHFIAISTNLKTGLEVWVREGDVYDAIHASLALPGLFTPVSLNGNWMADGGLVNPVPVSACRTFNPEIIIAVNLNSKIVGKRFRESSKQNSGDSESLLPQKLLPFFEQLKMGLQKDADSLINKLWSKREDKPGVFDVLLSSIHIMQERITRSRLIGDPPDILFEPDLSYIGLLEFDRGAEIIEAGRKCVKQQKQVLLDLIKHKKD